MLKDYKIQMKKIKKELNLLCLCTETLLKRMKDRIQTGRKYLKIIYLTKELYLQYINSFYNSTTTTKIPKNIVNKHKI